MTTWAILATGPSMNQAVADAVRGRCRVAAVSDAYRLAPWADVLVSTDEAWWRVHADAKAFAGAKYCGSPVFRPVTGVERFPGSLSATNSGLLACQVAYAHGATRLLLCGFDMHGTHFFGRHPAPLTNTPPERFAVIRKQFERWQPAGLQVFNCTPGSSLRVFAQADLEAILEQETQAC